MKRDKIYDTNDIDKLSEIEKDKILKDIIESFNNIEDDLEVFGCEVEDILDQNVDWQFS